MARHGLKRPSRVALAGAAGFLLAGGALAFGALATTQHAGPQGDGTAVTSYGWRVTPAGTQTTLADKPYNAVLSPDGGHLLVTNNGVGDQALQVIDTATGAVTQSIHYTAPDALFVGVVYSPDGTHAYASAGDNSLVRTYTVAADGSLTEGDPIQLATDDGSGTTLRPFPAGLAISADGGALYVADDFDNTLSVIDLATGHETRVALSDQTCTIGPWGDTSNNTGCEFPYAVALSHDGSKVYVSDWGQNTVDVVDTATNTLTGKVTVGEHPSALALNPTTDALYVSNQDSDSISTIDTSTDTVTQTLPLAPYRDAPVGTNPDGVGVSADGAHLFVANSGDNDVAQLRIGAGGRLSVQGLIPTGWYPSAVVPHEGHLFVLNAKGLGAGPNVNHEYIGSMIQGTLSMIDLPDRTTLRAMTGQVRRNDGFLGADKVRTLGRNQHVIPTKPGQASPIKHVIVIVNENRTYDQVLGDLDKGDGDPSLTLFDNNVAPNHHALSDDFTDLDNTYTVGEVSDDGWEWTTGANANGFDQKTMATNYGGRGAFYAGEGGTRAASPGADPWHAYLWDTLDQAGVSYRNYGWWATDVPPVTVYNAPNLLAHTDTAYAGFNMSIDDHQTRFDEWKREFDQYVANDDLPQVEFIKFPRDHTNGTSAGALTPKAMVADSDWAVGKLVDTVSHSRYWGSTAIFMIEDDSQDGPDHVDAHRTLAHVISPYTQTGKVDSTFYSSVSVLRTVELIFNLHPMTQFDATATPMIFSFTDKPNMKPYDAIQPNQPLDETNPATAPMAAQSATWNFTREDQAPAQLLNRAIWESVKGLNVPMPAPVLNGFTVGARDDG